MTSLKILGSAYRAENILLPSLSFPGGGKGYLVVDMLNIDTTYGCELTEIGL